jgi:hypothetical protein
MTVSPAGPAPALPGGGVAASGGASFAAALLRARAPTSPPDLRSAHPAISALASVERAQARLDAVLAAARAGRTFTAAELIGLQAEAYRCAQTVDLASKLAEQGAQSVKQALNSQL